MASGEFFAIGRQQWGAACARGIGHAATFLVMACGTGRDNATTRWSAKAVMGYGGLSWRRATACIGELVADGVVERVRAGRHPVYKLGKPEDDKELIWLPNTLVTGAGNEVPPVARLRQGQDLDFMRAFVELYGEQDLPGDGGLPRNLVWAAYERIYLCEVAQYQIFGFRRLKRHCHPTGPLERMQDREGNSRRWEFFGALESMGLVECIPYLAEGDLPDAELLHALEGDEYSREAKTAAEDVVLWLPGNYRYQAEQYNFVVPVLAHLWNATLVGVFRLTYRPHTARTAAWYAAHVTACQRAALMYSQLAEQLRDAA